MANYPQIPSAYTREAYNAKSKLYLSGVIPMAFYNQYKAGTALASSTTATSIFTGATALGSLALPGDFFQESLTLPEQELGSVTAAPGGIIHIHAEGTMGTSVTPNLTITAGLNDAGTYTAYTTSGAVATVATTAPGDWTLDVIMQCRTLGPASIAQIYAGGIFRYFSGANAVLEGIPLAHTITTGTTFVPADTLTVDAQFTWGTSSASNTITTQMAYVEMKW